MNFVRIHAELEKKIGTEIAKYIKHAMGKGPTRTETFVYNNLVLIKLWGYLLPHEKQYAFSELGWMEVKINRIKLANSNRHHIMDCIAPIIEKRVENMFYDLDPAKDEGYLIFDIA